MRALESEKGCSRALPPMQKDGQGERPAPGMDATFPLQCCPSKYCTTELRGQKAGLTKRNEERRSAAEWPKRETRRLWNAWLYHPALCSCKLSRVGFGKRVLLPLPQACRKGDSPLIPLSFTGPCFPSSSNSHCSASGAPTKNPLFQPPPSPSFSLPSLSFVGDARSSHPLKPEKGSGLLFPLPS